jgi:hypothetical protein
VDYLVTTLPEMLCTFLALGMQQLLRQIYLAHVPAVIIVLTCIRLVVEHQDTQAPFRPALYYLVACGVVMVLFWPDPLAFTQAGVTALRADQVVSYTAQDDPHADIRTAEDARQLSLGPLDRVVSSTLRQMPVVFETPGMRVMLALATETALSLARRISSQVHRPFASLVAVEWFAGFALTADTTRALQDWIEGCYKPSLLTDKEFSDAITAQDLLPWGDGPVAQALATREAVPGAQTGRGYFQAQTPMGLAFWTNPGTGAAVPCNIYLANVQIDVERWLTRTTSPAGTPLSQIFEDELGLSLEEQARQIMHREMLKLLGGPVPAPSLAGAYAALSGANAAAGAVSGALTGRQGGLVGGLLGGGSAVASQAQQAMERLLWWVGLSAWLLLWMPYILGTMQLVVVGFAPIAVCWMLVHRQLLRALMTYCLGVFWVYSSPVWFALIELLARLAASLAPKTQDALLQVLNWPSAQLYAVIVTVIGLAIIPVLMLAAFYGSLRVTNTLLRPFA